MKKDWTYKKLGEFIEEYSVRDKGQGFPVYSVTNTRGFCQEFFGKNVASDDTSNYKVVPRGCFAYNPSRINVGSVAWQNQEDNVSVSPLYVVFSVSPELRQDYLLYYIKSNYAMTFINALSRGAVRNNLRLSTLKTFDIPYASPSEQKNVVAELDLLSGMIEKQKAQIEELDKLSQSIFYDMFGDPLTNEKGWDKVLLKDISVIGDGLHGTPVYSENGDCYFINGNNLEGGSILFTNGTKKVSDEEKSKYYIEFNNQTIFVSINGSLGKLAYYNGENIILGKSACYIILNENVNKVYIFNILNSPYFKEYTQNEYTGTTIKNISLKSMRFMQIPLPPLSLQQEFAAKIEAIEAMKAKVRQSLKESETLFNSRMDYYFN